ncbi:protease modulator HflK [Novosphingobium mangrovi (ex Huang et al. 2023)]|uniref:Protease modulator HflK n=1 Tax=Novosphingobium mangrovi (ex Huang et al. 2023) TaxID=2976432 RepID=A0ABT2I8J2_9SPHN|nr:protease modulator HflK [Novosphingobium mangrovi (ex Huang et al. 2023)]MCT2401106.1 protease modulator HflK [Novosphingobium mangrovi (ex Huang et al. 2023)]
MAGRNSPWGGKGGGEAGNGNDDKGSDAPDDKGSGDKGDSDSKGPRNPWLPSGDTPPRRSASIEDIFRSRDPRRPGGGGPRGPGGGFPQMPRRPDGKSWLPLGIGLAVAVLLGLSMFHMIGPKEQGIVTMFGKYARPIDSGISMTLPWPIEQVDVEDVRSFRVDMIPDNDNEKLMLTSDKNLVDLSYLVRWNIKNLKDYKFRLADPGETVREVAEAAMRASIAQISLNDAISGAGRAQVEQDVRERMQRILDYYKSGVAVQGVEIKKADPPAKTKAAFEQVTVAQQEAERDRSEARAWAQQKLAEAQGNASQFDKVYEQYRLAPEVTKRRMYYETMEGVLRDNDTVVAEADGVTSYLPLPEVKRREDSLSSTTVTAKGGQ